MERIDSAFEFPLTPGEKIINEVRGLALEMGYVPHINPGTFSGTGSWLTSKDEGVLQLTTTRLVVSWRRNDREKPVCHYSSFGILGYSECLPHNYKGLLGSGINSYMAVIMLPGGLCLRVRDANESPNDIEKILAKGREASTLLAQALTILGQRHLGDGGVLAAIFEAEEAEKRQRQD